MAEAANPALIMMRSSPRPGALLSRALQVSFYEFAARRYAARSLSSDIQLE
jgi:hypothetical protein